MMQGDEYAVEATGRGTVVLELTEVLEKLAGVSCMKFCTCLICRTTC